MSDRPSFVMPFARRVLVPTPDRRPAEVLDDDAPDGDELDDLGEPSDPVVEYRGVRALRRRRDEFCCAGCFLVMHRNRLAAGSPDRCVDCAD